MIKNITLFQIEYFLFHFVNLELHLCYALACRTMTEKLTCLKSHLAPLSSISTGRENWVQFFKPLMWDNFLTEILWTQSFAQNAT